MFAQINDLKDSLYFYNMGKTRNSVFIVVLNLCLMVLATISVCVFGELQLNADVFDLVIEASSVIVHFMIFAMIALIRLRKQLKIWILSGSLLMQLGLYLNIIDEFVFVSTKGWEIWGDSLFLIGTLFLAYGIALWINHTYKASTLDGLTGAYNRRFFESMLRHFLDKPSKQKTHGCMVFFDLDDFKKINDKWGHVIGDEVLKRVTETVKLQLRDGDVVCRSGGEEFEVFLPGSSIVQAKMVAGRLLDSFHMLEKFELPLVTASFGVTEIKQNDTVEDIRKRSDEAMYNAKHTGKARVRVF